MDTQELREIQGEIKRAHKKIRNWIERNAIEECRRVSKLGKNRDKDVSFELHASNHFLTVESDIIETSFTREVDRLYDTYGADALDLTIDIHFLNGKKISVKRY